MSRPCAVQGSQAEFERLGYTIYRDVIDRELIAEASTHVDWLTRRHPDLRPENLGTKLVGNDPFWLRLVSDPRLLDIAEEYVGPDIALPALAQIELVMPRRPNSIRMLLETALAAQGLRAQVGMEIDSVPAILDLVARGAFDGVLSLNAVRSDGREKDFLLRPLAAPGLQASISIATFARRSRGPLLERSVDLLREMLVALWQSPR